MTMGDDLALLAIDPRRLRVRRPDRLPYALRAAELAELALDGRVAVRARRVEVTDAPGQPEERRLRSTLRALAGTAPPPHLKDWLMQTPRSLGNEYLSRLEDRRTIRVARQRARDGRTRTKVLSLDQERYAEVRGRFDAAVKGTSDDARARTLAALVHAAGLGPFLYGPLLGRASRARLAAIAQSDTGPADTATLSAALRESAARAVRDLLTELPDTYRDTIGSITLGAAPDTPTDGFDTGSHHHST